MTTIHNYSKTLVKVLVSATVSSTYLAPLGTGAQAAPKSRAEPKAAITKPAEALRLKLPSFPDVSLGAPSAYTVILPPQWPAQGKVQWGPVGAAMPPSGSASTP